MADYSKWDNVDYDALLNDSDEDEPKPARPGQPSKEKEGGAVIERSMADLADSLESAADDSGPATSKQDIPASLANAPLRVIYGKAQEVTQRIINPDGSSKATAADSDMALALLSKCRDLVDATSVFSPNETVSDVNTSDLKYLLLPFYQGQVLTTCSDLDIRAERLEKGCKVLGEFVEGCLKMEVVGDEATIASCRRALEGGMPDVSVTRQDRLERHKREKEIRERLEFLQEKRKRAMQSRREGDEEDDEDEDEGERELVVLMIEQSLAKAVTDIPLYRQEIELLAMRKKMGGAGPPRDARGFIGTGGAGRGNGGLQTMHIPKGALDAGMMNTAPVPEGFGKGRVVVDGATADVRRAQMQAGVFREMNPPSMTVEEWGEIEMQRMQEQQMEQAKRAVEKQQEESMMSAEDKEEVERRKKSDWDDWKDGVKKGSGNKNDNYFQR